MGLRGAVSIAPHRGRLDAASLPKALDVAVSATVPQPFEAQTEAPHFTIDTAELDASFDRFQRAFRGSAIYYALKANSDPGVIAEIAKRDCGFEAASWPEVELLLSLGVASDRIIYGTAIKPRGHVERAWVAGVTRFAADSAEELAMLASSSPAASVFIRVQRDDSQSVFQLNGKFGAPIDTAAALVRQARDLGLHPWGLSFSVGSQATRATEWGDGIAAVAPVFHELAKEGVRLEILNIGGGFPAPYANHAEIPLTAIAAHVREAHDRLPYPIRLICEPGRALVASSTTLTATVIRRIERIVSQGVV